MKKSRFTESQIVSILKEADGGMKVAEVCRNHGISMPTFYNWKSRYGGLGASELKLEAEHSKLKRTYADLAMEIHAIKELIEKSSKAGRAPWDLSGILCTDRFHGLFNFILIQRAESE